MKLLPDLLGQTVALLRGLSSAAAPPGARIESRFSVRRLRVRLRGGEQGNAMVETALVLPIFLMLLMGMAWFGFAINAYLTLNNAVSIAARDLANSAGVAGFTDPCAKAVADIESAAAPLLQKTTFTAANFEVWTGGYGVSATTGVPNGTGYPGLTCSGAAATNMAATTTSVTVQASYPVPIFLYSGNSVLNVSSQATEVVQ